MCSSDFERGNYEYRNRERATASREPRCRRSAVTGDDVGRVEVYGMAGWIRGAIVRFSVLLFWRVGKESEAALLRASEAWNACGYADHIFRGICSIGQAAVLE